MAPHIDTRSGSTPKGQEPGCVSDAPKNADAPKDGSAEQRVAALEAALTQVKQWSEAYPLTVFPEPDFARAHEVLQAAGMTLDAISASNMRHVITQVQAIVDAALSPGQPEPKMDGGA